MANPFRSTSTQRSVLIGYLVQYSQVLSQIRNRADFFMAGELAPVAAQYVYPLMVDLAANRVIVRSAEEACAMLELQRLSVIERGVVHLEPKVLAVDMPRNGRFRVWVDWQEHSEKDSASRHSSAVYFCRVAEVGFKIEMIHYTKLAVPEMNHQFAALAVSA